MRKPSASARRTGRGSSIVPSMPRTKCSRAKPAKANGRSAAAPRPAARPAAARPAKPADRRPSENGEGARVEARAQEGQNSGRPRDAWFREADSAPDQLWTGEPTFDWGD